VQGARRAGVLAEAVKNLIRPEAEKLLPKTTGKEDDGGYKKGRAQNCSALFVIGVVNFDVNL
jgi:hypothetical protein